MDDINALHKSFIKITKLSNEQAKQLIRWFNKQNILIQIEIKKEERNQYFKLNQEKYNQSLSSLCASYMAIAKFYNLENDGKKKNKSYSLSNAAKISEVFSKQKHRVRISQKEQRLLNLKNKIFDLKRDGHSVHSIAAILGDAPINFKVSHTYIHTIFPDLSNVN